MLRVLMAVAAVVAAAAATDTDTGCSITEFGAVAGNRSADARANADAIQTALTRCQFVRVPAGAFKILPVLIPSHRVLYLDAGASLVGSDVWGDYGVTYFMPRMGNSLQLRPLLSTFNATNVTITGGNGA